MLRNLFLCELVNGRSGLNIDLSDRVLMKFLGIILEVVIMLDIGIDLSGIVLNFEELLVFYGFLVDVIDGLKIDFYKIGLKYG